MLAIGETVTITHPKSDPRDTDAKAFRGEVIGISPRFFTVQGKHSRQSFLWADVLTGEIRVKRADGTVLAGKSNPAKPPGGWRKRTRPQGAETRERDKGRKHTRRATVPLASTQGNGCV